MRPTLPGVMLPLLFAALAACSSAGHDGGMHRMGHDSEMHNRPVDTGAREIPVMASRMRFTPENLRLRAGVPVAILLSSGDLAHDFYVRGVGHVVHAGQGRTARGGLMIKHPGTYRFWCTVSGHKSGGMIGTIVVAA